MHRQTTRIVTNIPNAAEMLYLKDVLNQLKVLRLNVRRLELMQSFTGEKEYRVMLEVDDLSLSDEETSSLKALKTSIAKRTVNR